MPTGTISITAAVAGISIQSTISRTGGGQEAHEVSLPAGQAGTLTTRTDDDTGEVTLTATPAVEQNDIVDVYWAGGKRVGMTVGIVVGNAVPIDGGAGDVLPTEDDAVIVTERVQVDDIEFDGDSIKLLVIGCSQRASIDFEESGPASIAVFEITAANEEYHWADEQGVSNPLTGNPVIQAQCSNGSTTAATLKLGVILAT